MLVSGWKKALGKSKRSQRSLANALRTNVVEVNKAVNGLGFFSPDKFRQACELLDVEPSQIYSPEVLHLLYGIGDGAALKPAKRRRVRVELAEDIIEHVDFVAEEEHMTRSQAASTIIRRAFKTRRAET